jgi:hypothetical protein
MPMEMAIVRSIVIAVLGLTVFWTTPGKAVTEEQYAKRCAAAQTACQGQDPICSQWRDAFNQHGSVCPGVNAPANADMHGPVASTQNATMPPPPNDVKSDTMADIQEMCSSKNGHHGFINQTRCIQLVMTRSNNPDLLPSNPYIGLYNLQAEKLIEDVYRQRISEANANIELQKAYLDVLARQSAANESAARMRAIGQQQEQARQSEQQRLAADVRAQEEAKQKLLSQQAAEQANLEQLRHECVSAMMTRGDHGGYGFNAADVNLCRSDPYAHLRPENRPASQRQVNCMGIGSNMINCTEH